MRMMRRSGAFVVLAFAGVACHPRVAPVSPARSSITTPTVTPRPPAPPPPPAAAVRPSAAPLSDEELFRRKSLGELNAEHPLADAFFDYDQHTLRDDARSVLQRDAAWLSKWSQTVVRIEGHCDERGTPEYNLALGDRRAAAVKEYLETLGVSPERIRVVSLGKEAQFCHEPTEDCWSQNRRGHFIITGK